MKSGTVFNIQKFSINDGPGIRTTVFLKGCPLNCVWCHNPESKSALPQIFFDAKKCIGCKACAVNCKMGNHIFENNEHTYNRANCTACGECTLECYTNALEKAGKKMTTDEVIKEVLKDKVFYDTSGGGITLSGGEPMMQLDFALGLLKTAKQNNLNTAIETCGFTKEENLIKIAEYTDIFLFDYKLTNCKLHKKYTGVSNELIISNLKKLDEIGAKIILRCPIIPKINDTDEHFDGIAKIANSLKNIIEINIEPYHPLGSSKSKLLDIEYKLEDIGFTDEETVSQWIDKIKANTIKTVKKA